MYIGSKRLLLLVSKGDSSPLENGINENSVQMKGNIAGSKGYYIEAIDKANSKIYLLNASTQPYTSSTCPKTGIGSVDSSIALPYEIGNTFSIVNNNKYYLCGKITAINNNVVTYESLVPKTMSYDPFTIVQVSNPDQEDYSFIVIEHPEAGVAHIKSNGISMGIDSTTVGKSAQSFGQDNLTFGDFGFVEGRENEAGYNAHAEGRDNRAYGGFSHAEGRSNTVGDKDYPVDMWLAQYSHAEGGYNNVRAKFAHVEGRGNTVKGENSHGEGYKTLVEGERAHAEGSQTTAKGLASHIEGTSSNLTSELFDAGASMDFIKTKWKTNKFSLAAGQASHVEGNNNAAYANNTHAEGNCNVVTGENAHVEGSDNDVAGANAHAEGSSNRITAEAYNSHVEGCSNYVGKYNSHAEGYKTCALNERCHSEGSQTTAAGVVSHIEGTSSYAAWEILTQNILTGTEETIITRWLESRNFSLAKGQGSHVQNNNCLATGKNSSAAGDRNVATGDAQFVVGKYNKRNDNALFIVGNGTPTTPSNALEVLPDGIKIGNTTITEAQLIKLLALLN